MQHANHMCGRAGDHTFDRELFLCVMMTEMCYLGGVVILCTVTTAILSMERAERCLNGLCRSILMRRICTHQKSPSIYGHVNKRGEMRGR